MSVLFNELLIPGWADEMIGLSDVTAPSDQSMNLPCYNTEPDLFFSEDEALIAAAKSLCAACPVRAKCLAGALSRQEPIGVWGGELFDDGEVIERKRKAGRPRLVSAA